VVVSVQFFGMQRALTKARELQVPMAGKGRVKDVYLYLMDHYPDLPLNEEDILVMVNNKATNMSHILNPNDTITFLPHVGGG